MSSSYTGSANGPGHSDGMPDRSSRLLRNAMRLFDVTATKDWANCHAKADVVVDGQKLLEGVPATYLLFLEKQLTDIHTFIRKLPVLDSSETWTLDSADSIWKTSPVETIRTKKVPRNHVKAETPSGQPKLRLLLLTSNRSVARRISRRRS